MQKKYKWWTDPVEKIKTRSSANFLSPEPNGQGYYCMRKEILYFERNCDVYLLYKKCKCTEVTKVSELSHKNQGYKKRYNLIDGPKSYFQARYPLAERAELLETEIGLALF